MTIRALLAAVPTVRLVWLAGLSALAAIGCDNPALQPSPPTTGVAFKIQPANVTANQPVSPAIEVAVQDEAGTALRDFVGTVTVSLGANQAGGRLSGTNTMAVTRGVATFADLRIDRPGSGYTFVAAVPGLTAVRSAPFSVVACNSDCWSTRAPMATPLTASAIGVVDGILYAVGGLTKDGGATDTVEAYDPQTNIWSRRASLSFARFSLGVGVVNGILYAVGGNPASGIVEAYDPTTDTWSFKASLPTGRFDLGIAVVNGRLYAIGGTDKHGDEVTAVEAYDPITDTWSTQAPLPVARSSFATAVANGVIYVIGGDVQGQATAAVDAYDPASNAWTTKAPMPTPRSGLGAATANGLIFAVGGSPNGTGSTVEAYDPVTDTWASKAPMPTARVLLAVDVLDGLVYAVGGSEVGAPFPGTNEAYQP